MTTTRTLRALAMILAATAVATLVTLGYAQDTGSGDDQNQDQPAAANGQASTGKAAGDDTADDDANEPANQNESEGEGDQQSSEEVMQQLLKQRENRSVAPTDGDQAGTGEGQKQVDMPAAGVKADSSVLGVAPGAGESQPTLHREGEVIVNRRGRLARAKDSNRLMFVFDSDKKESPEAPMILQACRTLETMEKIVTKRGESVPFIISGQVHTYRNQNYLMPTMMKIAEDRGNLK